VGLLPVKSRGCFSDVSFAPAALVKLPRLPLQPGKRLLDRKVGDLEVECDQRNRYAYFPSIVTIVRSKFRPFRVIKKDAMPPPTSFNVRRGSDPQRRGFPSYFVRISFVY
jgi:hypothetical protein